MAKRLSRGPRGLVNAAFPDCNWLLLRLSRQPTSNCAVRSGLRRTRLSSSSSLDSPLECIVTETFVQVSVPPLVGSLCCPSANSLSCCSNPCEEENWRLFEVAPLFFPAVVVLLCLPCRCLGVARSLVRSPGPCSRLASRDEYLRLDFAATKRNAWTFLYRSRTSLRETSKFGGRIGMATVSRR